MSEAEVVRFEVEGVVGIITVDYPPVNALGPGVREGIIASVDKGNADPAVKEQWTRYYTNLAQQEWGHARLGTAAAEEVIKKISEVPAQSECAALTRLVDERANRSVDDYHAREKKYDRRTNHGLNPSGTP